MYFKSLIFNILLTDYVLILRYTNNNFKLTLIDFVIQNNPNQIKWEYVKNMRKNMMQTNLMRTQNNC